MSRAFHEDPAFRAEQAHWYRRLREDGFDDVEGGRLDGYGHLNSDVDSERVFVPQTEAVLDQCAAEAEVVADAVLGIHQAATEALYRPEVWRGLPRKARVWWAFQALAGWQPRRAAEALRLHHDRTDRWAAIIRDRIATGGRHSQD
jgi:hypothetical protein